MNTNITVTSSSADAAANILQNKLPNLDHKVVLGTADTAASYGVDLSDFEDDGYISGGLSYSTYSSSVTSRRLWFSKDLTAGKRYLVKVRSTTVDTDYYNNRYYSMTIH